MPQAITFSEVAGSGTHDLTVYALSTCGFCRRALEFLRNNGIAFRYVYVDSLAPETRAELKAELSSTFGERIQYPFAVVDGKETLIGFIEANWKLTLGVA